MEKPGGRQLSGIQIMRGIAAMMVVVHHALEISNGAPNRFSPDWLTTFGAAGVDIFFVISGFIMAYVCFLDSVAALTPSTFLKRRIVRIYPIYWICCAGMLAIIGAGFLVHHRPNLMAVISSLLLLPSPDATKLIGVSWTLTYEMYFYLAFTVALLLGSRLKTILAITGLIVGLSLTSRLLPSGTLRDFFGNPIAFEFLFGLWLYAAFDRFKRSPNLALAVPALLFVAAAPLWVVHPTTNGLVGFGRVFAWGVPAVWIVAAFLSIQVTEGKTTSFLVKTGDASYSIYLTHSFVMIAYGKLIMSSGIGHLSQEPFVMLAILASLGIGLFTHFFIENPLLSYLRYGKIQMGYPVMRAMTGLLRLVGTE